MRWARALVAVGLLAGSGAACAEKRPDAELVVEAVDATRPVSHRFTFSLARGGESVVVQGIVEDDLRYKLQLSVDGRPAVEQIVVDDAVALRFLDPAWVDRLLDPEVAGQVDESTDVAGVGVTDALRAGRWVVDLAGAPSPLLGLASEAPPEEGDAGTVERAAPLSDDPLFDARTALDHLRVIGIGNEWVRFDPEAISPTYRADEDPFPAPEEGSGITRYDSRMYELPGPGQALQGRDSFFPSEANFRRMAAYVDGDGRVIRVMEVVGVTPRLLEDLFEYCRRLVEETAPADVLEQFDASVVEARNDPEAGGAFALEVLNSFRRLAGKAPVAFRTTDLQLQDFGAADLAVVLPSGTEVLTGSLAGFRNIGLKPLVPDTDAPPTAGVLDQ